MGKRKAKSKVKAAKKPRTLSAGVDEAQSSSSSRAEIVVPSTPDVLDEHPKRDENACDNVQPLNHETIPFISPSQSPTASHSDTSIPQNTPPSANPATSFDVIDVDKLPDRPDSPIGKMPTNL